MQYILINFVILISIIDLELKVMIIYSLLNNAQVIRLFRWD